MEAVVKLILLVSSTTIFHCASFVEDPFIYITTINESLQLEGCKKGDEDKIEWKFQDTLLFADGFLVRLNLSSTVFLQRNSSVYIHPISLVHIGKYECLNNARTLSTYFVEVEGMFVNPYL